MARTLGLKRFQFDAEWQRDFFALAEAIADYREHTRAYQQLDENDVHDEAVHEIILAIEAQERIALLEHALKDLR